MIIKQALGAQTDIVFSIYNPKSTKPHFMEFNGRHAINKTAPQYFITALHFGFIKHQKMSFEKMRGIQMRPIQTYRQRSAHEMKSER